MISTTDAEGGVQSFTFDQYNRLISSISPEGIQKEIEYDANNNKTQERILLEAGKVFKSVSGYDMLDQVIATSVGTSS